MKSHLNFESDFLLWVGFKASMNEPFYHSVNNTVISLAYEEENDFCRHKEWLFVNFWTFYKEYSSYRIDELYLDLTGCLDADIPIGRYVRNNPVDWGAA